MSVASDLRGFDPASWLPLGRSFVHPLFDLMIIGGGLSLLTASLLYFTGHLSEGDFSREAVIAIVLFANSAHFAASTVRLYSKPGAFEQLPVMTMLLPLVSVVVLTLGLLFPAVIGGNLYLLYLSWSPYHYAAQTYGLASMYAARSQRGLDSSERWILWAVCLLPFLYAFVQAPGSGLGWILPPSFWLEHPAWLELRWQLGELLIPVVFVAPFVLLFRFHRRTGSGLPAICWLLILTNGIWWVTLTYVQAFVWATIFHGVQYLAIVIIFHLRDHPPRRVGRAAWLAPALKFYGACLLLGYALFEIWPYVYVLAGFGFAESALMCAAVINLHHFIVDRGIWQIRSDARNQRSVQS